MKVVYDGTTLSISADLIPRAKASVVFSTLMKNYPDASKAITWKDTEGFTTNARGAWISAALPRLDVQTITTILATGPAGCVRAIMWPTYCVIESNSFNPLDCLNRMNDYTGLWKWATTAKECPHIGMFVEETLNELPLSRLCQVWKYCSSGAYAIPHYQFARIIPRKAIPAILPLLPDHAPYDHVQYLLDRVRWVFENRLKDDTFEANRLTTPVPAHKVKD